MDDPFILIKDTELTKETQEIVDSYKTLMGSIVKEKDNTKALWERSEKIKPIIITTGFNPATAFVGVGYKSDQA